MSPGRGWASASTDTDAWQKCSSCNRKRQAPSASVPREGCPWNRSGKKSPRGPDWIGDISTALGQLETTSGIGPYWEVMQALLAEQPEFSGKDAIAREVVEIRVAADRRSLIRLSS